jgi:hypothetical protein
MMAVALPSEAFAQEGGDDMNYCAKLAALYRRYVQNSPGRQYDAEAAVAQDDCQKGNTAVAIPILERKLRESGFTLPSR